MRRLRHPPKQPPKTPGQARSAVVPARPGCRSPRRLLKPRLPKGSNCEGPSLMLPRQRRRRPGGKAKAQADTARATAKMRPRAGSRGRASRSGNGPRACDASQRPNRVTQATRSLSQNLHRNGSGKRQPKRMRNRSLRSDAGCRCKQAPEGPERPIRKSASEPKTARPAPRRPRKARLVVSGKCHLIGPHKKKGGPNGPALSAFLPLQVPPCAGGSHSCGVSAPPGSDRPAVPRYPGLRLTHARTARRNGATSNRFRQSSHQAHTVRWRHLAQ